jgi:hypothetical protein
MEEPDHLKNTKERLRQTIVILQKLTQDLGLPYESDEVQAVKTRLYDFVRTGEAWKGSIPFLAWDRIAVLDMANNKIEITLKAVRKR